MKTRVVTTSPTDFMLPVEERSEPYRSETILDRIRRFWERIETDHETLDSELDRARKFSAWRPLGFETCDEMLRSVGVPPEGEIRARIVEEAKKAREQAESIGQGTRTDLEPHSDRMKLTQGETKSYLLRRLARDNPEILNQWERGEFPSVRQAAIAAGIVKVPTPLEKAQRAIVALSGEDRTALLEWLEDSHNQDDSLSK